MHMASSLPFRISTHSHLHYVPSISKQTYSIPLSPTIITNKYKQKPYDVGNLYPKLNKNVKDIIICRVYYLRVVHPTSLPNFPRLQC